MNRADDVASLFQRFGASSDSYFDIENDLDYQETPAAPKPVVALQRVINPVVLQAPLPQPPVEKPLPPQAAPLAHLLTEVAQARQAEALARNHEALTQSLPKDEPLKTPAHVIAVIAAKGGVGKSTVCAALTSSMKLPGGMTLAIDLDPQNALRHHLNVSPDIAGLGDASLSGENWRELLLPGSADTHVLPYGSLKPDERRALQHFQENDPDWLTRQIARMQLSARDVVLLDVPCGDSQALQQALKVASQILVVLTADAACYLTLDQVQGWVEPTLANRQPPACDYVINQFDASRTFCRDMREVMSRRLGERLLGTVHKDDALAEALAYGHNPVLAPGAAQGTQDLLMLGHTLISRLLDQDIQGTAVS